MATFQEIMAAAANADKAGDTEAAQKLVDLARGMMAEQPAPSNGIGPEHPQFSEVSVPSMVEGPNPPKVDNFGDTIRAATKGPIEATKAFAAGVMDPSKSPTASFLPEGMPEALKRPLARGGDVAATAIIGGLATPYAFGAGLIGETLGGSPTNEKKLARDLMMAGEVAVPQLSGVSGTVSGANRLRRAGQTIAKEATDVQRTARAADDLGITPSLGAGGKGRAMTAAGLEKVPLTGSVIGADAQRFVGEIETAFHRATAKIGRAADNVEAGEALQEGTRKFVVDFKDKSTKLYDGVGRHIPKDTSITAPNTLQMINDALAPFEGKPALMQELGLNKWRAIANDLEDGLSWEAASSLRTSIGESIGKINGAMKDMDQGKLARAYGSLTEDLGAAAKASGPDAEKAWTRANNFYRRGAERIEKLFDAEVKGATPERAVEAFAALTKTGARADSRRLYSIKASLPKDEWNTVAASIVERLGKVPKGQQNAAGDVFSPARFLSEWNNLTPEAKSILAPPEVRKELAKLAEVAEGAKRANAERNFSNTGTVDMMAAIGIGSLFDIGTTAATVAGVNVSARAMTTPRFLTALNRAARGDAKAMRAIAKGNDPLAQDARTILRLAAADAAVGAPAANVSERPAATGTNALNPY